MINEISSINSGQASLPRAGPELLRSSNVPNTVSSPDVALQMAPGQPVVFAHGKIREAQEEMNQSALTVRKINLSLGMAKDVLAKMKEALVSIRKQYPPYALDDPRRLAILNAVSGLKKQIDALAVPQIKHDAVAASQANRPADAIPYADVDPEASIRLEEAMAWHVPTLDPARASDAELERARLWLDRAVGQVDATTAGMWRDVVHFLGDMTPLAAERQAGEVREALVNSGNRGGIADDPTFLNNVLGY